jgi:lycopene beta-cyclase
MNVYKPMDKASNFILSDENSYDFIIAGAGCAGLSLLHAILNAPKLNAKRILIVDKSFQKSNDRTWCFWENQAGEFESLVCKSWDKISIHKQSFNKVLTTAPFSYKMLQGLDFYNHIIAFASTFKNVTWVTATVESIDEQGGKGIVHWKDGAAVAEYVFSSLLPLDRLYAISQSHSTTPFLWQHFKGQLIQFDNPVFDDTVARLMDFNVDQKEATGFMYVLPLDSRTALFEYTLFSSQILNDAAYDKEIATYLQNNHTAEAFIILHEEKGAIPMTSMTFERSKPPVYVIGTLGNAVKASTGYAFQFIQKQVVQIVDSLLKGEKINTEVHQSRHAFYDAVLLYILKNNLMEGTEIFKRIFAKNKAATIFKFLSNTSDLWEDIKIMRSLPTRIFLPAAIKVLLRRS